MSAHRQHNFAKALGDERISELVENIPDLALERRRTRSGATATSSVVVGNVCFQAVAKLTSMARYKALPVRTA